MGDPAAPESARCWTSGTGSSSMPAAAERIRTAPPPVSRNRPIAGLEVAVDSPDAGVPDEADGVRVGEIAEQRDRDRQQPQQPDRQQREAAARAPGVDGQPGRQGGDRQQRVGVVRAGDDGVGEVRVAARVDLQQRSKLGHEEQRGAQQSDRQNGVPMGLEAALPTELGVLRIAPADTMASAIFGVRLGSGRGHLCSHPGADDPFDGDTDLIEIARCRQPSRDRAHWALFHDQMPDPGTA